MNVNFPQPSRREQIPKWMICMWSMYYSKHEGQNLMKAERREVVREEESIKAKEGIKYNNFRYYLSHNSHNRFVYYLVCIILWGFFILWIFKHSFVHSSKQLYELSNVFPIVQMCKLRHRKIKSLVLGHWSTRRVRKDQKPNALIQSL